MKKVEKIIHCAWLGGGNLADIKGLDGIESWIKYAPEYEIWLWTDKSRNLASGLMGLLRSNRGINKDYIKAQRGDIGKKPPHELEWQNETWQTFLTEQYGELLKLFKKDPENEPLKALLERIVKISNSEVGDENVKALRDFAERYPDRKIFVKDVSDLVTLPKRAYAIEMSNRGINFAGASDIVRYTALAQHGGVYLDVDLLLKKNLGNLTVEDHGLRAGVLPSKDLIRGPTKDSPFQKSTKIFDPNPAYVMNGALATHRASRTAIRMRDWVEYIYEQILPGDGSTPSSLTISSYWHLMPTKSTLDITGPNLVRDALFYSYSHDREATASDGKDKKEFNEWCRKRLSLILKALGSVKNAYEKQFFGWRSDDTFKVMDVLPFNRHAEAWPDGELLYQGWWQWYNDKALFPMDPVDFETAGNKPSATSALLNMKY